MWLMIRRRRSPWYGDGGRIPPWSFIIFTIPFRPQDGALKAGDLESTYELWQKAQWDGKTGVTQEGDIPWVWLCNVDHLYYVRDGLQVAGQKIHPHGHGWSIVNNVDQWEWK